jgi:hypothetical protein
MASQIRNMVNSFATTEYGGASAQTVTDYFVPLVTNCESLLERQKRRVEWIEVQRGGQR